MKEPIVIPVVHELHVVMGTKGFGRPLVNVWESGHEFPIIFKKVTTCMESSRYGYNIFSNNIYFNAST